MKLRDLFFWTAITLTMAALYGLHSVARPAKASGEPR